jgi:hypothetical protein
MKLLSDAKKAISNPKEKKRKAKDIQINLFNSVNKKELW